MQGFYGAVSTLIKDGKETSVMTVSVYPAIITDSDRVSIDEEARPKYHRCFCLKWHRNRVTFTPCHSPSKSSVCA